MPSESNFRYKAATGHVAVARGVAETMSSCRFLPRLPSELSAPLFAGGRGGLISELRRCWKVRWSGVCHLRRSWSKSCARSTQNPETVKKRSGGVVQDKLLARPSLLLHAGVLASAVASTTKFGSV